MAALSSNRNTESAGSGLSREFIINNGTTIYQGGLVIINSSGYAIPLANATAGQYVGVCFRAGSLPPTMAGAGATGNSAGTVKCATTTKGTRAFAIASATVADLGKLAYGVDDQTVQSTTVGQGYIIGKIVAINSSTSVQVDLEDRVA